MKASVCLRTRIGAVALLALASVGAADVCGAAERDVSLAGEGWRFTRDPTGKLQAEAVGFDDGTWEAVRVPHDWAIAGPFDEAAGGGTGKLPWKGVGWYRRTFALDAADAGSAVFLDFDGVMAGPEVYVNGAKAGAWGYGYASVRVDVTPFVKFGGPNVLAVRADTTRSSSRWYPGAGIYRKVTLRVRHAAHFANGGVFVTTPEVGRDTAAVRVAWELEGTVPAGAKVKASVSEADGRTVATVEEPAALGAALVKVANPRLWDVDAPNLYFADVTLADARGVALSCERVRFGIRTIAFPTPTEGPAANDRAANGFHLNGRRVQLKGVNLHSDLGPLGMAFDKSAMRRQLQLMKQMGANALRTSHNCPAPEVLDLCDEMGILVWDEAFDKWDAHAGRTNAENLEIYISRILKDFVRRDRNHPSVIIWSMANEITEVGHNWAGPNGLTRERCAYFREVMRREDATRPVGNGNIGFMQEKRVLEQGIFDDLDVTGWNYGASYRNMKRRCPRQAIVYSESASAFSTYGFYEETLPTGKHDYATNVWQTSGYDFTAGPDIADVEFARMEEDVYCCGEFVWTGIDYLGEPTPFSKESRSSYFGIVDLTGVPKDRYWLYRSLWNDRAETVHLVPHWTWPGREGKSVPVFVYTSGDAAELFVNGKSMGVRRKGELVPPKGGLSGYYDVCARYRLMWFEVPYEPGELKAVAWRGDRKVGEASVRTAGPAAALAATVEPKLTNEADELLWVQVDALDARGVRNPLAMNRVNFRLEGPGKILGVGNGNAHAFESFAKTDSHPLFYGKAVAVVRRDAPGRLVLTVSADGLRPASAELP